MYVRTFEHDLELKIVGSSSCIKRAEELKFKLCRRYWAHSASSSSADPFVLKRRTGGVLYNKKALRHTISELGVFHLRDAKERAYALEVLCL